MRLAGLRWGLRRRFWSNWQALRFRLAKERRIPLPTPDPRKIGVMPQESAHRDVPLRNVMVFDKLPKDESSVGLKGLSALSLFLTRKFSPMQSDAPEISADIHEALNTALSPAQRREFRLPVRPAAFETGGFPELETLAVQSPYAVFIERDSKAGLLWDFCSLGDFEHQPGLRSLRVRVLFEESADTRTLKALQIISEDFGAVHRGDPNWEASKAIAICAATTQLSLTRHFNYVHLICANHWDVSARNHLDADHPVFRLLWPHLANGLYTNYGITRSQMRADGDFTNIFSFSHRGLMDYFDSSYEDYDIRVMDPIADWNRRGLQNAKFEHPSQENLVELFTLMQEHARRYLYGYYSSDKELQDDAQVSAWLESLDRLIPNGISGLLGSEISRDGLARLIGGYIYEGNTIHDMAGTTLWDYQLWADKNPTRIYSDGRRVPVDVFQRMVANNFGLQLKRAPLLDDYGYLALDAKGEALFARFFASCRQLQEQYDQSQGGTWRLEPKNLEMSMNG